MIFDDWDLDSAPSRLPQHALDEMPEQGKLVITDKMRKLALHSEWAVERGGVVLLSGASGLGKSTMLAAIQGIAGVRVVNAEIPPGLDRKPVYQLLLRAISGEVSDATIPKLQDKIRAALSREPTLLIVDEAQRIGLPALLVLRWLKLSTGSRFGLVLAGIGLHEYVEADESLSTRMKRRVRLTKPDFDTLLPALRQFHPVLSESNCSDEIMKYIHSVYAKGVWRLWATLAEAAEQFAYDSISAEQAAELIEEIRGSAPTPYREWLVHGR